MIEENLENSKAWFRRGEAYFCLNDWDNAKADFEKTVQLDQDNKAAKNKVRVSVFFRIWDGMGWDGMGWISLLFIVRFCYVSRRSKLTDRKRRRRLPICLTNLPQLIRRGQLSIIYSIYGSIN